MNNVNYWKNQFKDYLLNNTTDSDGSHDLGHFERVYNLAKKLSDENYRSICGFGRIFFS